MSKAQPLAQQQVFQVLDSIAETIPAPFCWMDLTGKFLGLNMKGIAAVGAPNKEYVIGKNVYDLSCYMIDFYLPLGFKPFEYNSF